MEQPSRSHSMPAHPLPLLGIAMSRIGPESDVLLRNLFEHYCHDMSEWFDVDTGTDGSYSHDTSSIWAKEKGAYLARIGTSIAGFAVIGSGPTGWVTLTHGMFTSFLSCVSSDGAASAGAWLLFFGTSIPENGSSECSKRMRRRSSSGGPRYRVTVWVLTRRSGASSTGVGGDFFGLSPIERISNTPGTIRLGETPRDESKFPVALRVTIPGKKDQADELLVALDCP